MDVFTAVSETLCQIQYDLVDPLGVNATLIPKAKRINID